jgi:4a-hydroxytetrahydrobiopterin dehydratase
MKRLTEAEITERLAGLPDWERHGSEIRRTFTFDDFSGSMAFVNRVAVFAEAMNHHPDIDIRYAEVTLTLSTHDAGGLTARDFDLAAQVEG